MENFLSSNSIYAMYTFFEVYQHCSSLLMHGKDAIDDQLVLKVYIAIAMKTANNSTG